MPSEAISTTCASRRWRRPPSRRRRCGRGAIPTFPGYDTYLDDRMQAVLPGCLRRGTRIVSNQGWINPEGAAAAHRRTGCASSGKRGVKVAAVDGSLITDRVLELTDTIMENGRPTIDARADPDLGRGLPGRRADRRGAARPARRSWSPAGSPTRRSSWRR